MKKQFSAVILGAAILVPSLATVAHANGLEDKYFTNDNPALTQQERQALAIAQRWQAGATTGTSVPLLAATGPSSLYLAHSRPAWFVLCSRSVMLRYNLANTLTRYS